jgi:hypothetical protein
MTTALILLLLLAIVALPAIAVVRALRQDPARRIPCSSCDGFSPRWADGGVGRWSI